MIKLVNIFIITIFFICVCRNIYLNSSKCNIKRKNIPSFDMWNKGNYIDLGTNNGDSLLWFYNLYLKNRKYSVRYPRINISITKNFNTYIFEANPALCDSIKNVTIFIKKYTQLKNIFIYCPIIVSINDGVSAVIIEKDDLSSSKYYNVSKVTSIKKKKYTLPTINFTRFIIEILKLKVLML